MAIRRRYTTALLIILPAVVSTFKIEANINNFQCKSTNIQCLSSTTFTSCINGDSVISLVKSVIQCPEGYVCNDDVTGPCVLQSGSTESTTNGRTSASITTRVTTSDSGTANITDTTNVGTTTPITDTTFVGTTTRFTGTTPIDSTTRFTNTTTTADITSRFTEKNALTTGIPKTITAGDKTTHSTDKTNVENTIIDHTDRKSTSRLYTKTTVTPIDDEVTISLSTSISYINETVPPFANNFTKTKINETATRFPVIDTTVASVGNSASFMNTTVPPINDEVTIPLDTSTSYINGTVPPLDNGFTQTKITDTSTGIPVKATTPSVSGSTGFNTTVTPIDEKVTIALQSSTRYINEKVPPSNNSFTETKITDGATDSPITETTASVRGNTWLTNTTTITPIEDASTPISMDNSTHVEIPEVSHLNNITSLNDTTTAVYSTSVTSVDNTSWSVHASTQTTDATVTSVDNLTAVTETTAKDLGSNFTKMTTIRTTITFADATQHFTITPPTHTNQNITDTTTPVVTSTRFSVERPTGSPSCKDASTYPAPACNQYYVCTKKSVLFISWYEPVLNTCVDGYEFSSTLLQCVLPALSDCP